MNYKNEPFGGWHPILKNGLPFLYHPDRGLLYTFSEHDRKVGLVYIQAIQAGIVEENFIARITNKLDKAHLF